MPKVVTDSSNYKNIADSIRNSTGEDTLYTPSQMPQAIKNLHEKSYEEGQKIQYDQFWDTFQQKGKRANYTGAFANWTTDIFKPKYDITAANIQYLFYEAKMEIDLVEYLKNLGVSFSLTNCTNCSGWLQFSQITRLGVLDLKNCSYVRFDYATYLETIDELILGETNSGFYFTGCNRLKNLKVSGNIYKNFNISPCPLTKESIGSVVNAAADSETGRTMTFSKSAVDTAFETSAGATDGSSSEEWHNLIATKPNWTVSLV